MLGQPSSKRSRSLVSIYGVVLSFAAAFLPCNVLRRCVGLTPSSGLHLNSVKMLSQTINVGNYFQAWRMAFVLSQQKVRSKVTFELHASRNQYVVLRRTGMGLVVYKGLGERSLNYKEPGLLHTRLSLW